MQNLLLILLDPSIVGGGLSDQIAYVVSDYEGEQICKLIEDFKKTTTVYESAKTGGDAVY